MSVQYMAPRPYELTAFVILPDEGVRVRVRGKSTGPCAWRCDACGRFPNPQCPHARAIVADMLATGRPPLTAWRNRHHNTRPTPAAATRSTTTKENQQ